MGEEGGQRLESPESSHSSRSSSSSESSWNADVSGPSQEFPPKLEKGKRYLYINREQEDSYSYNIGITDDDPETKRQQLQVGNSRPLILKKTFRFKDEDVEKKKNALHKEIEEKKIGEKTGGGENWFKILVCNKKKFNAVVEEIVNVPDNYEEPKEGKWLYIIREQEDSCNHKIGVTEDPKGRYKGLRTANGRCLIFKRFFKGNSDDACKVENELRKEIEPKGLGVRMMGGGTEWFQVRVHNVKDLYAFMSSKATENNLEKVVKNVICSTV